MANYGPNQNPDLEITVFYDCRGKRASKLFTCPYKARSFYASKFKAGKSPSLKATKTEPQEDQ